MGLLSVGTDPEVSPGNEGTSFSWELGTVPTDRSRIIQFELQLVCRVGYTSVPALPAERAWICDGGQGRI